LHGVLLAGTIPLLLVTDPVSTLCYLYLTSTNRALNLGRCQLLKIRNRPARGKYIHNRKDCCCTVDQESCSNWWGQERSYYCSGAYFYNKFNQPQSV